MHLSSSSGVPYIMGTLYSFEKELLEWNYKPLSDLVSFIRSEWILLQTSFFIWWISKCGLSRVYQPVVVYLYPPCCASPSSCSWWCICIHGQTSLPESSFTVVHLYPWRLISTLPFHHSAASPTHLPSIPSVTPFRTLSSDVPIRFSV